MTPRSDGSPASTWIRRCACVSAFNCGARSAVFSNKKPFCAKKLPPFNCSMDWNKSFCCDSRATSAPVASSTSSGVGASITATMVSNCGKAFSKAASRCRHGMFGEISWLMSVVIAKCVAAYQDETIAQQDARGDHRPCILRANIDCADNEGGDRFHGLVSAIGMVRGSADRGTGLRRQEKGEMVTDESLCGRA